VFSYFILNSVFAAVTRWLLLFAPGHGTRSSSKSVQYERSSFQDQGRFAALIHSNLHTRTHINPLLLKAIFTEKKQGNKQTWFKGQNNIALINVSNKMSLA